VIVPVRDVVAVFAATVNETVPLPDPVAVPVRVIQLALVLAVQPHPAVVETVNEPVPPAAATDWDAGEIVYAHGAAPVCVTEKT
jgi:hypothetical protein